MSSILVRSGMRKMCVRGTVLILLYTERIDYTGGTAFLSADFCE